jgi:hypothetical protein
VSIQLEKAIRAAALEPRDAAELSRVLARLIAGKTLHEAFGAPGDWGYDTPLGQAVLQMYQENGGSKILADRT